MMVEEEQKTVILERPPEAIPEDIEKI